MIVIQCTNCKRQLSIDDAFAGGVCRCQHCGTIQTVPAAGSAAPARSIDSTSGRSLYAQTPAGGGTGPGLDDLASYVASSGLSSGRLARGGEKPSKAANLLPLWIGIGVAVVAILVAVIVVVSHSGSTAGTNGGAGGGTPGPSNGGGSNTPAIPTGPNFSGVALEGKSIIFSLDRGSATTELGDIETEVYRSLGTFGPDRKFDVSFWTDKTEENWDYPEGSTTFATRENIDAAKSAWANSFPGGGNDGKLALTSAIALRPDTIVLVSGKGDNFPPTWVADVMALRGNSGVRFDTFDASGNTNPSAALKDLAAKTGGTYAEFTKPDQK